MDEIEIVNLHKRNKARKTPQPKKVSGSDNEKKAATKSLRPKKVPKSPEFIETDVSSEIEEEEPRKASGSNNEKKAVTKTPRPKKSPNSFELIEKSFYL